MPETVTTSEALISANDSAGRVERILPLLYFFSGAVGIAYQVLWARMLSLQFGVSIFGVVVTAAAFMIGLGVGALYGRVISQRVSHPLKAFAGIEFAVAIYAICLPFLLMLQDGVIGTLAPDNLSLWYTTQLVSALILIALPATALGFGFPMVLKALENSSVSLAKIYGLNTCGGAIGALIPLMLLPVLGWSVTVWAAALIGVFIALWAWKLSSLDVDKTEQRERPTEEPWSHVIQLSSLVAYSIVGAAALMLEVAWTRLFGMLLLRTEYVMAIILAVFLIGIGSGSLLANKMRSSVWLSVLPSIAAVAAIASLWGVVPLAAWAEQSDFNSLYSAIAAQGIAVVLLTLPVTLVLGAWLPLLNNRLRGNNVSGARLYGVNSLGAAVGALVAGLVVIPLLGSNGAILLAAFMLFAAGIVWASRKTVLLLPVLILCAWPVSHMLPTSKLLPSAHVNSHDLTLHEDALAITHVVERSDGQRLLLADLQRMDASTEPLAVISQQNQVRLPLLLHSNPESVLFLGLGTGISASASLNWPDLQRTAVELSQGAIEAVSKEFSAVNGNVAEHMTIVRDDARRYLKNTGGEYDVIVGDLFHPDLVGRSALLSVQQFRRAKLRLNDGGLFVQWLALNQFDPSSLQVVLRTFQQAFPDAVLFVDGFRLAMVGGNNWQPTAQATKHNLHALDSEKRVAATGGEGMWTWLGRYWGPIHVPEGDIQSEWAPVIEYSLPKARYRGGVDLAVMVDWLLQQRVHVEYAAENLTVSSGDTEAFERGFIATELAMRAWVDELNGNVAQAQRLMRHAYQANASDRWISGTMADRMYAGMSSLQAQGVDMRTVLESILKLSPDHAEALRDMWQLEVEAGNAHAASIYRQRYAEVSPLARELAGH